MACSLKRSKPKTIKKLFLSLTCVVIFFVSSCFAVYASDKESVVTKGELVARYTIPESTIFNDIEGNYNILATLRMSFPDICFQQNLQSIQDVINGKKSSLYFENTEKGTRYNYNVRLYLLEPQLRIYCNEFYKIGVVNPLWNMIFKSDGELTVGKIELVNMLEEAYIDTGILNFLDF